jgi:hypothetical protein
MRQSAAQTKTITCAEARSQLALMLVNATDERLADFTGEGLARMYRTRAADIDLLLTEERERRAEYARCHAS